MRRLTRALLVAAVAVGAAAGCGREEEPAYGGDPEGRIVTAGATADELVTRGATARRIAQVELSAGLVERWFTAQERLEALAATDSRVRRVLDEGDGGATGEQALTRSVRRLESESRIRDAIEGAGLTTREFVLTALALHQALLASSPGAPAELRSLAARNVRFVGRNSALLERLAAPRPPRVLAYGDTVTLEGPFIDTVSVYDEAPYDMVPYPSATYGGPDTIVALDTAGLVVPPVPDTIVVPPVLTPPSPPATGTVIPPLPRPVPVVPPPARGGERPDTGRRADSTAAPVRPRPDSGADSAARARRDTASSRTVPTLPPLPLPPPPVPPTSPPR